MNSILILAIAVILVLIVYLIYVLYLRYFNFANKTQNKETLTENFKNIKKIKIDKKNKNLIMTIEHNNKKFNIEIELFDEKVPLTTKNFRQIAINGINGKTYNNSIFHRVIKNFMLQGGDIINSNGTGSISIYGNNFKDENFYYKHDKPGLLSMANSGKDTNGSQFFITTVPTPHLNDKHVVFGKVVKGLDNILELQNIKTDVSDKPIKDIRIINIKEK